MATLEELRKENERLKNFQKAEEELYEIGRERKRLEKENRNLRSPGRLKTINVLKRTGRGFGIMGKGLVKGLKSGVESYAHSQGTNTLWEKPVKRVRKVKRVKKR